jgi:zinc/manganese transport system ATP-binding protein
MRENNQPPVVLANNVSLTYPNATIVSDISMQIFQGEFIGILGPNGSGKSTFLRALLGLIKPSTGRLLVLGKVPNQGRLDIGYMPQIRHLFSMLHLSSRAILEASIHGTRYGLPLVTKASKVKVVEVLDLVNAYDYADRPFQQLSGGERQRIFLAQALLDNPKMLLLDEPLSNLDPRYQDIFIQLLHDIRKHLHVTILMTAHDPNPLLRVIHRVLYFARGKSAIGTINEIITSDTLSTLYGTPIEVMHFKNRLFVLGENQFFHDQEIHHHV